MFCILLYTKYLTEIAAQTFACAALHLHRPLCGRYHVLMRKGFSPFGITSLTLGDPRGGALKKQKPFAMQKCFIHFPSACKRACAEGVLRLPQGLRRRAACSLGGERFLPPLGLPHWRSVIHLGANICSPSPRDYAAGRRVPRGGALKKEIAIFFKMAIFHLRGYF